MTEYTNNRRGSNSLVSRTGEEACCTQRPDYTHLSCAQVRVCTKHDRKYPRGGRACASRQLKCHPNKSKGRFTPWERTVPYQGAVVFAVLVGQVCNGGWNAGTEELLPLVQVALMDFVKELMVSGHVRHEEARVHGRGKKKPKKNEETF